MLEKIKAIRKDIKGKKPLIHCITNPISINQCANLVLALGARPVMAEHPQEVEEITAFSSSLLLNLGNITEQRAEAMKRAICAAKDKGIPITLDLVGIATSELRRRLAGELLKIHTPTVIKGNYSEIKAFYNSAYCFGGVDSDLTLEKEEIADVCVRLARENEAIVLASGKTDIIASKDTLIYVKNGCERLGSVTGTGCMQGALVAAYLSSGAGIWAVAAACGVLGICGERAAEKEGSGSFMVGLMDMLSLLTDSQLENDLKMEVERIEGA